MAEEILIRSETNKKTVRRFRVWIGILLAVVGILVAVLCQKEPEHRGSIYYLRTSRTGFQLAFDGHSPEQQLFIIGCLCLATVIVLWATVSALKKCELSITEKNIRGKTVGGKAVVLPIHMISGYSTKAFLSTIAISTPSGVIKFALIDNYETIGKVLSRVINQRQSKAEKAAATAAAPVPAPSNMDELVKLKGLLDQGIITEQEFDAKKKQLLGL